MYINSSLTLGRVALQMNKEYERYPVYELDLVTSTKCRLLFALTGMEWHTGRTSLLGAQESELCVHTTHHVHPEVSWEAQQLCSFAGWCCRGRQVFLPCIRTFTFYLPLNLPVYVNEIRTGGDMGLMAIKLQK